MCEVFTLASAGLGIAQSVVGYQAASAQSKAQSAASRQNAINAARAAQDQYSNLSVREQPLARLLPVKESLAVILWDTYCAIFMRRLEEMT